MNTVPPDPVGSPGSDLSRDQLVASSSCWLAVSLNLGCQGIGYVYQRRWGAFWIGGLSAVAAAVLLGTAAPKLVNNLISQGRIPGLQDNNDMTLEAIVIGGYAGITLVGVGSAVEAGLAVRQARRRLGR